MRTLFLHRNVLFVRINATTPSMLAYWDRDLICRDANDAYFEWFGKRPEQMFNIAMVDLLESVFPLNEPYVRRAIRGHTQTFERTLIKADGSIGHTIANYIPDLGAGGIVKGFFDVVTDITSLRKAEVSRKASHVLLDATCPEPDLRAQSGLR